MIRGRRRISGRGQKTNVRPCNNCGSAPKQCPLVVPFEGKKVVDHTGKSIISFQRVAMPKAERKGFQLRQSSRSPPKPTKEVRGSPGISPFCTSPHNTFLLVLVMRIGFALTPLRDLCDTEEDVHFTSGEATKTIFHDEQDESRW